MLLDRGCLSINNYCDINCRYCYFYNRPDINTKDIECFSLEDIQEIILNIDSFCKKNNSKFKLGLVGSGEPLLSSNIIINLLDWMKVSGTGKNVFLYTISNGFNTKEELLKKLYDYRDIISVSFSLDGYKEIHDYSRVKYMNGEYVGTYDKVINTISTYEKIFGEKPSINVTVHRQTIKNTKKLMDFFQTNNFKKITFSKIFDCNSKDLDISQDEFDMFIEKCELLNKDNSIEIRNIAARNNKVDCSKYGAKCGVGKTNIFFADKKVYPCGRFIDNNKYIIGKSTDNLEMIESSLHNMFDNIVIDKCCYDELISMEAF